MAKGSAMGLWRGKKGSSVFYKVTNSNNAQKQGIRERIYEVANPQSNAQVTQRQKLLPAQRVYGQLADILKRSWQGVDYGGLGTQQFMKYALKQNTEIPFVDKDDDRAIPGAYQISKGTISEVTTRVTETDLHATSLGFSNETTQQATWGEWSQLLINGNDVKDGDQLTFVLCFTSGLQPEDQATSTYRWEYGSVVVDSQSTTPVSELNNTFKGFSLVVYETADFVLGISADVQAFAASAVIVSRLNGDKFERSTSRITVDTTLLAYWFSSERKAQSMASYQKAAGAASINWPVEIGEDSLVTRLYDVLATAASNGTASGGGRGLEAGTAVTLTATPAEGYYFGGWYKDGDTLASEANPYTFVVSAATAGTYQARFTNEL